MKKSRICIIYYYFFAFRVRYRGTSNSKRCVSLFSKSKTFAPAPYSAFWILSFVCTGVVDDSRQHKQTGAVGVAADPTRRSFLKCSLGKQTTVEAPFAELKTLPGCCSLGI